MPKILICKLCNAKRSERLQPFVRDGDGGALLGQEIVHYYRAGVSVGFTMVVIVWKRLVESGSEKFLGLSIEFRVFTIWLLLQSEVLVLQ